LQACHSEATSGHLWVTKTHKRVAEQFYWKGKVSDVQDLVSGFIQVGVGWLTPGICTMKGFLEACSKSELLYYIHIEVAQKITWSIQKIVIGNKIIYFKYHKKSLNAKFSLKVSIFPVFQ